MTGGPATPSRWMRAWADVEATSEGRSLVMALASLVVVLGVLRAVGGVAAWALIRSQLAAERVRIPASAERMAGRPVRGPLAAFREAEFIRRTTLKATGGKTYGELDEDDPMAPMAMQGSLLRSSLFTSILAFGVAAAEVAQGLALVAIGAALLRVDRDLRRQSGTPGRPLA